MQEELIYKKMYLKLFNAVSDALLVLEAEPVAAEEMLKQAQLECEELFLDA